MNEALLYSLRDTLKSCPEFDSDRQLQNVFTASELLSPWEEYLYDTYSKPERVDLVIARLGRPEEELSAIRTNALVLLVCVLRDRAYKKNSRYQSPRYEKLKELAQALKEDFSSRFHSTTGHVSHKGYNGEQVNSENQQMIFTDELIELLKSVNAVGKVSVPKVIRGRDMQDPSSGTGWLITPELALTCLHVLQNRSAYDDPIRDADLETQVVNSHLLFDYTVGGRAVEYRVKSLECSDPVLDYALVRLQNRSDSPLPHRGYLHLDVDAPLDLQTYFYIIQHPKGQPQQLSSGRFDKHNPEKPEYILHYAPTESGTSGAPVLNRTNWGVVALHKRENTTYDRREAILLKNVLEHIKQTEEMLYNEIVSAAQKRI